MRRFLKKLFLFALLTMLFAIGLDYMISKGLLGIEDYKFQVFNDIFKGKMKNDVLIMGDSRAFSHYNPRIIDSACHVNSYDIGIGGSTINVSVAEYHCYKAHNEIPKLIVLEVDYLTLATVRDVKHNYDPERFFPTVYDATMRCELKKIGYGFLDLNCPLYRYFGNQMYIKMGLLEFLGIRHSVIRRVYKGFSPESAKLKEMEAMAIDSADYVFEKDAIATFEGFLDECKRDNVFVLLVNSPLYYVRTNRVRNIENLYKYCDSIAKQKGFVYLNYADNELCYDTVNFAQTVHLNASGATKFSRIFARDLNSLHLLE